jgi:thiosulfate dehydrogenase [quinone] large subunit
MTKLTGAQAVTDTDWRSDASIAYAILRLTFGLNICLRGVVRIANGTDVFAADLLKQLQATVLPTFAIQSFGLVLPWVEATIGLLIIVGLQTRVALILGGLMMSSLIVGTMLVQNFQNAFLQLLYSVVFFLLLALRSWNLISVDGLGKRS